MILACTNGSCWEVEPAKVEGRGESESRKFSERDRGGGKSLGVEAERVFKEWLVRV